MGWPYSGDHGDEISAVIFSIVQSISVRHESPVSRNVHAIFQQRLDGLPTDEPHLLPYGRAANNKLDAFDMQVGSSVNRCVTLVKPFRCDLSHHICFGSLFSFFSVLNF